MNIVNLSRPVKNVKNSDFAGGNGAAFNRG
jgi:hypothetical protein